MKRLFASVCILFFSSSIAWSAEKIRVSYEVVCDNSKISRAISEAISERLKRRSEIEVSERLPSAKLYVYAQQDVGDRVNPNGWSFAIAHASNQPTYFVGAKLLHSKEKAVEEIKPVLIEMLQEQGFIRYMNVAHLDEFSEKSLSILADNAVDEFLKRVLR
jgi:hypothetical protein